MIDNYFRSHPLLIKIMVSIFSVATVVSFITAGGQLYFSFQNEKERIESILDHLQGTELTTLSNLFWNMEEPAAMVVMEGIITMPDIAYIEVSHDINNIHSVHTNVHSVGTLPLNPSDMIERQYSLVHTKSGGPQTFGSIRFVGTTSSAKNTLLARTSNSLLLQLINLLLTCFIIVTVFIGLFNRHINKIVSYTKSLKIGTLNQRLELDRSSKSNSTPDEIDYIVDAINTMRERLQDESNLQRQIEDKLRYEKQFSDQIINSVPGLLFVLDDLLVPVKYNDSFLQIANVSSDQLGHFDIYSLVALGDKQQLKMAFRKAKAGEIITNLEVDLVNRAGKEIPHLVTIMSLTTDNESLLVAIATDLSERKQIESQLRQSQKMEAIGTLAGGIAHDFNNILSAIIGYLNLVQLMATDNKKVSDYLTEIEKASFRAKDLVAQILAFSRKKSSDRHPLKLKPILEEARKLLRSSIPTTVEIKSNIQSEEYVIADPTEIHQIVMNLCTNAYHAMESQGGEIEIALVNRVITSLDYIQGTDLKAGRYVELTVSDNGSGIDESVIKKVFEPYFSTKETGKGTGLGLAVVHGIVTQCQGGIHVYSRPGEGTKFSIFLPIVSGAGAVPIVSDLQSLSKVAHGHECIMVVDDDRNNLKFIKELLIVYGYSVKAFDDVNCALEYFERDPYKCAMTITDYTMPGMTGDKFGEALLKIRENYPMIIMSGFSPKLKRQDFLDRRFAEFLPKPVDSVKLLVRIREILSQDSK